MFLDADVPPLWWLKCNISMHEARVRRFSFTDGTTVNRVET